jgi:hypothetical protein
VLAAAKFSVTARLNSAATMATTAVDEASWTPIHYPNAIWDKAISG